MVKITPEELKTISKYIRDACGIVLDSSKAYLVETRLSRLMEEVRCASFGELVKKAQADVSRMLQRKIIDAITTNETLFFRDGSPFEMFQYKILPEVLDRKKAAAKLKPVAPRVRIWSAACSTGQEVYSIAILIKELIPPSERFQFSILGTDISDAAIAQASYGQYNKFEIERGLPQEKLRKYFTLSGATWKIKDEIRAMASFKKHNLMDPMVGLGKFDIIFCRNVAIYFAPEDKTRVFNKIADALEPPGYLIIGSSESLTGISTRFEVKRHVRSMFYQLKT